MMLAIIVIVVMMMMMMMKATGMSPWPQPNTTHALPWSHHFTTLVEFGPL